MRILIHSPSFYPNLGGIETIAGVLARELALLGHDVRIFTETASFEEPEPFPFVIVRKGATSSLLAEVKWSHVFLQMGVSLKGLYPLLIYRRHWVVTHQTWYHPPRTFLNRLKRSLTRFATNIFCSKSIEDDLDLPGTVIGNPYDSTLFRELPGIRRDRDLVFLGRLVSDKGVDVLLRAMAALQQKGKTASLTIVGDGPERDSLERLVVELELTTQVQFAGPLKGPPLVEMLNQHRTMVVPSLWNEPFGIVALEGLACGCVVVASSGGGLKDAVGPCGLLFKNGDASSLARQLHMVLDDPTVHSDLMKNSQAHLQTFTAPAIALNYDAVLRNLN